MLAYSFSVCNALWYCHRCTYIHSLDCVNINMYVYNTMCIQYVHLFIHKILFFPPSSSVLVVIYFSSLSVNVSAGWCACATLYFAWVKYIHRQMLVVNLSVCMYLCEYICTQCSYWNVSWLLAWYLNKNTLKIFKKNSVIYSESTVAMN